jgi:hypothetical protein
VWGLLVPASLDGHWRLGWQPGVGAFTDVPSMTDGRAATTPPVHGNDRHGLERHFGARNLLFTNDQTPPDKLCCHGRTSAAPLSWALLW